MDNRALPGCAARMMIPCLPVPPGATDCHFHVYGPAARYPVAASNPSPVPFGYDLDGYQAVQARLGLQRAVVVQPSAYGLDNSATLDAVAALGQARAVVAVTPATPEAELVRLHAAGARGARAVLLKHALVPWEELPVLAERIAPLGWHIQMQFDGGLLPARAALIRSLACPVMIDHIGRFHAPVTPASPAVQVLLRLLESGNVWVKASSPYGVSRRPDWADTSAIARALIANAPERVVWGSNWPHPNEQDGKPDEARVLDWLGLVCPSDAVRRAVLVDNPGRFYDF